MKTTTHTSHHVAELLAEQQAVRLRGILAVTLLAIFYTLAFAVVAALGWVAYQAGQGLLHGGGLWSWLLTGSFGAAGLVVLGSIVPRGARFVPPGPALERATHTALFEEVEQLALDTGQKMPDSIYLLNDVNAFVADHGGVLGLGSQRVMGIGLPLLCGLDMQELRSVLGHEFGHFSGGDTRLGPWVYRGRLAMIRAAQNLAAVARALGPFGVVFRVLSVPFTAFAERYLLFTLELSRLQELAADEVGAKLAGCPSTISALRSVEICASAFDVYFQSELVPLIQIGYLPPVAEGFNRFLKTDAARRISASVKAHGQRKTDAFDSHPALVDRVAELQKMTGPRPGRDDRPAAALLHELGGYELELVQRLLEDPRRELKVVTWKRVGSVLAEQWHRNGADIAFSYLPKTFDELPADPKEHRVLLGKHLGKDVSDSSAEEVERWARWALMQLVFAGLTAHGLSCESLPGEPVRFSDGRTQFAAAEVVDSLLRGVITREDWRAFCRESGLSKVDMELLAAHSPRYQAAQQVDE